jgi:hypothetical protein
LTVRRLLELPMHIMDTALFYPDRMNLTPKAARVAIGELMDNAGRFGGALTISWHDRSIAPERLWGDFYVNLLRDIRERGAWLTTAAKAVSWFRTRRSAVFEELLQPDGSMRIKISMSATEGLPGMRVRVHRGSGSRVPVSGGSVTATSVDYPLRGGVETLIAV